MNPQHSYNIQSCINRGSLFQVNDDVFRAMETAVRRVLTISHASANPAISIRENTKMVILNDPAVLTGTIYLDTALQWTRVKVMICLRR